MITLSSFFSGCGGLDLGFERAGFKVVWANEFDVSIHETYIANHKETILCKSDIRLVDKSSIPNCDGFIGGPPCQSWSEGGKQKGLDDERGKLFLDYVDIIKEKHPKFFVIENVKGILDDIHYPTFVSFLDILEKAGYVVYYKLLNAADFRIPQDRYRVFVVGFAKELNVQYSFPTELDEPKVTLRKAISDLHMPPTMYKNGMLVTPNSQIKNHDVYDAPYDSKYMARNRVRSWEEVSFTIQAQARNCPLHPQAPKMRYLSPDRRMFVKGKEYLYRRLSVRECARIQSFPDSYTFHYRDIQDGYKMVGNAVPPRLAYYLAVSIKNAISSSTNQELNTLIGYYKDDYQLVQTLNTQLYYVRTGFRHGSFSMPLGSKPPIFLILHNRDTVRTFRLKQTLPVCLSKEDLKSMGFKPKGDYYLGFQIEEELKLHLSTIKQINIKQGREGTIPHLAYIDIS